MPMGRIAPCLNTPRRHSAEEAGHINAEEAQALVTNADRACENLAMSDARKVCPSNSATPNELLAAVIPTFICWHGVRTRTGVRAVSMSACKSHMRARALSRARA